MMAGAGMMEICSELQSRRRGNRVVIIIRMIPFAYDVPFAGTRLTAAIGWSESCRAFFQIPRFISAFRSRTDGKLDRRSLQYSFSSLEWSSKAYGVNRGDVTIAGTRIVLSTAITAGPDKDWTFATTSLQCPIRVIDGSCIASIYV